MQHMDNTHVIDFTHIDIAYYINEMLTLYILPIFLPFFSLSS